jgi:hypothetical protein
MNILSALKVGLLLFVVVVCAELWHGRPQGVVEFAGLSGNHSAAGEIGKKPCTRCPDYRLLHSVASARPVMGLGFGKAARMSHWEWAFPVGWRGARSSERQPAALISGDLDICRPRLPTRQASLNFSGLMSPHRYAPAIFFAARRLRGQYRVHQRLLSGRSDARQRRLITGGPLGCNERHSS